MRRILVLLTMVALMVVMSVAPAFAAWQTTGEDAGCRTGHDKVSTYLSPGAEEDGKVTPDGYVCQIRREYGPQGQFVRFVFYDNRDLV